MGVNRDEDNGGVVVAIKLSYLASEGLRQGFLRESCWIAIKRTNISSTKVQFTFFLIFNVMKAN